MAHNIQVIRSKAPWGIDFPLPQSLTVTMLVPIMAASSPSECRLRSCAHIWLNSRLPGASVAQSLGSSMPTFSWNASIRPRRPGLCVSIIINRRISETIKSIKLAEPVFDEPTKFSVAIRTHIG